MIGSHADRLLKLAKAEYQAGNFRKARECCQEVLASDAGTPEARHVLGRILIQLGDTPSAINALRQALHATPGDSDVLYDLGRALHSSGQLLAALECFEKSLAQSPTNAEASNAKGIMLSELGRREEGMTSFQHAIEINPSYASPYNNLGNELMFLKDYEKALAAFEKATLLKPDFANAHNGRGNVFLAMSQYEEALGSYEYAIRLQPGFAEAWNNRGNVLAELRRHDEAVTSFQRALEASLNDQDLFRDRTGSITNPDQYKDIFDRHRRSFTHSPFALKVMCNIGNMLLQSGQQGKALELLDRVLEISPADENALGNKAKALLDLGLQDAALAVLEQNVALHPDNARLFSTLLFNLNYLPGLEYSEVCARHHEFGSRFETPLKAGWRVHTNNPNPDRPLRVGFVSADLRSHPVGFFLEGILAHFSANLQLYAYDNHGGAGDSMTDRLRPLFVEWRNISNLTDENAAEKIRADCIDILIDLSGHTEGNRLLVFARKPAPVQVTYLGYFVTTGLSAMDYFLVNRWQIPVNEHPPYTETIVRLPDFHLCFTPPRLDLATGPLPADSNGYVTFGNFNALAKMNGAVISCWANILRAAPSSRLFLKTKQLDNPDVVEKVRARFSNLGIEQERLVLEGQSPYDAYFARYQNVDIALDPFPYPGTTITLQALWMGVPVLTLSGDRHMSRNGAGIMQSLQMQDWIATDQDDYIARAVAFSNDLSALATLRTNLRSNLLASPICNPASLAGNIEDAFRNMWRAWCAKQPSPM